MDRHRWIRSGIAAVVAVAVMLGMVIAPTSSNAAPFSTFKRSVTIQNADWSVTCSISEAPTLLGLGPNALTTTMNARPRGLAGFTILGGGAACEVFDLITCINPLLGCPRVDHFTVVNPGSGYLYRSNITYPHFSNSYYVCVSGAGYYKRGIPVPILLVYRYACESITIG